MYDIADTREIMERFEMEFLNETRNCEFRTDVSQFMIAGQKYGPFKAGDRSTLPNWVIEKLASRGYADVVPSEAYESLRRLQNLRHTEDKQPHKLQPFPPFLYSALKRKLLRLQSDKTSLDPQRYDEIEKAQNNIEVLMETRLSKIMRVAKSGAQQDKRKHMAYEERWLADRLNFLLSAWRELLTK
ncbi:hypothetical protein EU522_00265 [Candidatus Thorarchaeota archaeon]|nr:MAG: hypothetical protein EU522_00265 [Candidatus Thorarchaeota archaeon]